VGVSIDVVAAARYYKLSADQGHSAAQNAFGLCLCQGTGISIDFVAAAKYFKLSADQGHSNGQNNYALCLQEGMGVSIDVVAAARYFKLSADQGDSFGQNRCGLNRKYGKGVPVDVVKALKYFELAAGRGNSYSQYNCGVCYACGIGSPVSQSKAVEYFKLSADQGNPYGQFAYGYSAEYGKGMPIDLAKAAEFYKRSANQNMLDAQFHYAIALENGIGVAKDESEADKYMKHCGAFQSGSIQIDHRLDIELGRKPLVDMMFLVGLFKWAADGKNSYGQCNYGVCLEFGLGVEMDVSEAAKYYKLSADQQNATGECNYGICLGLGKGICPNRSYATFYMKRSAEHGCLHVLMKLDEFRQGWSRESERATSEWIMDFTKMREVGEIGKGSTGVVKLFEELSTKRRLAVKFLNDPSGPDADLGRRLVNEVAILIKLRHPCVLGIVGYSLPTRRSPAMIATEYAANGSLRSALDEVPLPSFMDDTGIAMVISGVVHGMRFLHSSDVIHRDLKPANILLDNGGWPLIGNFSKSRFVDLEITQTKQIGTPMYMAPEMYDDEYTTAADVYSFALILYEVLVGRPAFDPELYWVHLLKKIQAGERPPIPAAIPEAVREVIERGWSTDPAHRPSFDHILATLRQIEFKITPNVDVGRLTAFTAVMMSE
jgi:TPR repeat protein